jgi:carbamoyltransferase
MTSGMFFLQQSTHRMLVCYHPIIGHLYVSNLRARLPNELGGYFVVTNSSGFRSDFEFVKARGGKPRILMFGDSFTAGDNCSNEKRYSDQLARMLDAEVYNYGLSGSGTDQQLLIYREFAHDVEADLIIICVQIDSIRRIQQSHRESIDRITRQRLLVPKPYFTLENGELLLHNACVPLARPPVGSLVPETIPETKQLEGWRESVLKWYRDSPQLSRLRHWVRNDLSHVQSEVYRLSGIQPYPDFRSPHTPGWKLMKAILQEFVKEARPTPVLIVPIPGYEYYLHGAKPVYQQFFEQLEDRTGGVHVLDVSTPLIRLPWKTRQQLTFRVGGHFTPFANEKVARTMADLIERRRLLGAHPERTKATSTAAPVPHRPQRTRDSLYILGLSCFYHNSAACLIRDGEIVAAAEEERFTRIKNDRRFPHYAANYCLEEGGVNPNDLDAVVYYDNTALTFERILHSQLAVGDKAEDSWLRVMPTWLCYKLHIPQLIRNYLKYKGLVLQEMHHRSHAASAFYASPFRRAVTLTIDGVGEWATASIGVGCESELHLLKEMHFPHSLGLLYSAFTQFTGFKVNSGEYKMMGLAPYGEPKYVSVILDRLIDLKQDGSIELNLDYFGFLHQPSMTNERFAELFGGPARRPESRITRREMDLARSVQAITEEAMLRMARHAHQLTGERYLCLAGGVALNCVGNGRLLREGPFEDIWIQPAAGDAGCALGAALDAYHTYYGKTRMVKPGQRSIQGGSYCGPSFSDDEIAAYLESYGYPYCKMGDEAKTDFLARCIVDGKVVGHFSGRMEYGPRALGARSILGDARNPDMQAELNLKIKYRESFRPFAPTVLAERVQDYFELERESPYMLIVAPVRKERRQVVPPVEGEDMLPRVRQVRSDIPAVTHVDYSARIQTVVREDHPAYTDLLKRLEGLTGSAVIVNTSFNVRGEPIVCTPADAYRCFMRTEMNVLALGNYVLLKEEQPPWPEGKGEGLESEDVAKPEQADQPEALLRALKRLFRQSFLPVADALQKQGAILVDLTFRRVPSTWKSLDHSQPIQKIFEFPKELDTLNPAPEQFAEALSRYWAPGPAADALRPLLTELVQLGLRYPADDALEEEVSESVYVMF